MRGAPHHRSNRDVAAEHAADPNRPGQPLCGSFRRWGALLVRYGEEPSCRRCRSMLAKLTTKEGTSDAPNASKPK